MLEPPTVTPSFCQITYSCSLAAGSPRTDLCDLSTTGASGLFDPVTGGFVFSTTDPAVVPFGVYSFVITASVGSGAKSADSTFQLEMKDPCVDAAKVSLVTQSQTNGDYFYDGSDYTFVLNPPTVTPSFCEVTYTCSLTADSPRTDLCNLSAAGASGIFDAATGGYVFSANDRDVVPTGIYTFEITASVGSGTKTAKSTFLLNLKDLCASAVLTLT